MVQFLIFIIIKKSRKQSPKKTGVPIRNFFGNQVPTILISLLILLLTPVLSSSQSSILHYKIVQGGDNIGWLRLEKNITGNKTNLLLVSELKTRIILLIEVSTKETSIFENGQLLYSSQYRKTNGTVKVNKQTSRVGERYQVNNNGDRQFLPISAISTNLLSLYFQEPVGFNTVYCDKHERYIKIVRTDDGGYKIIFPDGNSNIFFYSHGICTRIRINNTFYTAEIIKTT